MSDNLPDGCHIDDVDGGMHPKFYCTAIDCWFYTFDEYGLDPDDRCENHPLAVFDEEDEEDEEDDESL